METKVFFSILNHHKCPSHLFPFDLNTYVMGLHTAIIDIVILSERGWSLNVRF